LRPIPGLTALLLVLAACAPKEEPKPAQKAERTQREKDSILANSKIPNAGAVGKAMRASDSVAAKVQITDTIGQ
jgi:hypothetical protein